MIGRVTSVEQDHAGVTLDGDHTEGATSLTVTEAFDLEPDGGRLSLPSGEVVEYDTVDTEGLTVPLVDPLPEPVEDAERLEVFPPMVTTVAYVSIDDSDESQPIPVTVRADVAGWSTLAPGASLRFEVTKGGDLVATDVIAGALAVAADQVSEGTIRSEWQMSSDGAIVMGDGEDGEQAVLTSDGLRLFVAGPNGVAYEAVSMTNGVISFGVMGKDGTRLGGISREGAVSGTSGTFSGDVRVKGTPVVGQVGGGAAPGWMDNLPRGVIARFFKEGTGASIVTGVERAYLRTSATLLPGRQYRIRAWMRVSLGQANSAITMWIRYASGRAELGSPTLPDTVNFSVSNADAPNHNITGWAEGFLTVSTETNVSFLLTYRGDYGATPTASRTQFYVEDVGPTIPLVGGEEEDPDKVLYRSTWRASSTRMYDKAGAAIPDSDGRVDLWYWRGTPTDFQNTAVLFGGGAEESTHSLELGKTMQGALGGATLHKSEIFLQNKIWYGADTGGLALSSLAGTTLPTSKTIDATFWGGEIEAGEGAWVEVPTSWFTNGASRGFCLGDKDGQALNGSGVLTYLRSGSFHGLDDTDPPLVRHTYSR